MKYARFLYIVSRPRFWLYELGTFFLGVIAGISATQQLWGPEILLFALYFLFPANLLIYGINDIYDYETDLKNPKKQGYEILVTPDKHRSLWLWIIFTNIPFILIGLFTLPLIATMWLTIFVLFATFYSAEPIRAKARPFLDSFFSAGHYVATGVFGYHLAGGDSFPVLAIAAGMLWAMAMHAFSAIPDIEADAASGVPTIATKLGAPQTTILCAAMYATAGLLGAVYFPIIGIGIGIIYAAIVLATRLGNDATLFRIYKIFPALNAATGGLLTILILIKLFS